MTIDKQALRERYSPQPIPKCHICGAEMTVQRMSASRITYGCTGATYDDNGCHYVEGRSIADDHYEQSRITVVDVSDPDVLTLLDDLEAAEHTAAVDHEAACSLVEENEELKRRIAELEAREINLPPYSFFDFKQGSPFKHGAYCHLDAVNAELAKHGIKIVAAAGIGKGE